MIRYVLWYDESGRPLMAGPCDEGNEDLGMTQCAGFVEIDGPTDLNCRWVDVAARSVLVVPAQPSHNHRWDCGTSAWVDRRTLDEALAQQWLVVRAERDRRIAATDWTQLPDVPLATKDLWAVYRQALRDITSQLDPFNIVWPTPPQS